MPLVDETFYAIDTGDGGMAITVGAVGIDRVDPMIFDQIDHGNFWFEFWMIQLYSQLIAAGVDLTDATAVIDAINGATIKVME